MSLKPVLLVVAIVLAALAALSGWMPTPFQRFSLGWASLAFFEASQLAA